MAVTPWQEHHSSEAMVSSCPEARAQEVAAVAGEPWPYPIDLEKLL